MAIQLLGYRPPEQTVTGNPSLAEGSRATLLMKLVAKDHFQNSTLTSRPRSLSG